MNRLIVPIGAIIFFIVFNTYSYIDQFYLDLAGTVIYYIATLVTIGVLLIIWLALFSFIVGLTLWTLFSMPTARFFLPVKLRGFLWRKRVYSEY